MKNEKTTMFTFDMQFMLCSVLQVHVLQKHSTAVKIEISFCHCCNEIFKHARTHIHILCLINLAQLKINRMNKKKLAVFGVEWILKFIQFELFFLNTPFNRQNSKLCRPNQIECNWIHDLMLLFFFIWCCVVFILFSATICMN